MKSTISPFPSLIILIITNIYKTNRWHRTCIKEGREVRKEDRMIGAGKVTKSVDADAVAKAIVRDIQTKGQIQPKTAKVAKDGGFLIDNSKAKFKSLTEVKGGINANRFAATAGVSPKIKGDTAEVNALANAIMGSSHEVGGRILADVLENIAS
jgi:hypothetical protein